jgi:hypothetical protein
MKIVKMGYMNDEQKEMRVRILDLRYDPTTATGDIFVTLKSCEYREFEVHIPDNAILYVKKWPYMVMISYSEQSTPLQSDQPEELPQYALDALQSFYRA